MRSLLVLSCLLVSPAVAQEPEVEVATIVAFTEGPTVDAEGNVYFTEVRNNRILKLQTNGELVTYRENSNAANGLIFDSQWRLIACEGSDATRKQPRVTRTDLRTGKIEVLADKWAGKKLNGPNDVTIDGRGRIYFTDPEWGRSGPEQTGVSAVFRVDPDGRVSRILAAPDIQRPNGIVISPDDRILYLVEAMGTEGGARMIRAYDLRGDGTVRNMRVHYNFYPGRSADGMTIDTKGNLWAAAGLHRRRGTAETLDTKPGVHVISPKGKLLRYIPIPEDTVTNCAFGGPDMKTLYVTAGKTLFRIRTDVVGTRR
jgi:gluconolactonase